MAETIPMLALSPTMEEGVIVKWIKQEGDSVAQSDVLCEVETDKATMEFESPSEGILLKILVPEGQGASVGKSIAIIGSEGEDITELTENTSSQTKTKTETPEQISEPKPTVEKTKPVKKPSSVSNTIKASPLAKKLARERGIDLSTIQGSGPDGRITKEDIENTGKHAPTPAAAPVSHLKMDDEEIAVSQIRKIIAQRLSESKFSAPHYYLKLTAKVDNLIQARQKLNAQIKGKISFNAFMMKCVATALERHPMVNASWTDHKIIKHGSADIALAVAQPEGLITPIVRDCIHKGILEIDGELKVLIEKAQTGKLSPDEYSNSTFTITNLGSFGIEEFTAIINPPNSVILAIGKMMKEPVVDDMDHINIRKTMKLTLSCDHRIIDGALGAAFLSDLKDIIEYPIHHMY